MKAKDVDVHYPDGRIERMRTIDDAVASARDITDDQLREMSEKGIFSRRLIASELLDKREKLAIAVAALEQIARYGEDLDEKRAREALAKIGEMK